LTAAAVAFVGHVIVSVALSGDGTVLGAIQYGLQWIVTVTLPAVVAGFAVTRVVRRHLLLQAFLASAAFLMLVYVAGDLFGRLTWIEPLGPIYLLYGGLPTLGFFILVLAVTSIVCDIRRRSGTTAPSDSVT
ncbi:MAG TPA: hypothetical protein VK039_00755, partial [Brevibacterium sp.]|nr:hypothetical protein [Brevibacterium sp.]